MSVFCVSGVPPRESRPRPTRHVSDIKGIRFPRFLCVSDVPPGKVDPDPPGKCLKLGVFVFLGFLCFPRPPLESLPRPNHQALDIVGNESTEDRGARFSPLLFCVSSDVGPPQENIPRPTRQITEPRERGVLLFGFCVSIASLWEASRGRDPPDKCPRSGRFPSLRFSCFSAVPRWKISREQTQPPSGSKEIEGACSFALLVCVCC